MSDEPIHLFVPPQRVIVDYDSGARRNLPLRMIVGVLEDMTAGGMTPKDWPLLEGEQRFATGIACCLSPTEATRRPGLGDPIFEIGKPVRMTLVQELREGG